MTTALQTRPKVETLPSLTELATEINSEHEQCVETLQKGLEQALSIGEKLIEAKSQVAHGEWGPWLAKYVTFSDRTARGYMRVVRELPKTATVADLSLRDALKSLAAPRVEHTTSAPLPPLHPANELFPWMSDTAIAIVADSIKKVGLLTPIVMYEGQILDGKNRWKACQLAGVAPRTVEYDGDDPDEYCWSLNALRTHYTPDVTADDPELTERVAPFQATEEQDEVVEVPLESLSIHPVSLEVYGEPDDGMKANLELFGQRVPIDIDNENRILSGGRRYAAAKALGWTTIKAKVRDFQGNYAIEYILISNDYATKPEIVKVREANAYKRFLEGTPPVDSKLALLLEQEVIIGATLSRHARCLREIVAIKQDLEGKDPALVERFEALEARVRRCLRG